MKLTQHPCAYCGKPSAKVAGHVNRSRAAGLNLYCDRKCAGLGRRKGKTKAQKIAEKKAYDAEYRKRDVEAMKARKHAYHLRTYDPAKAAVKRKGTMARHVEYCRRPEYKAWKRQYDKQYNAAVYGPFADCALLLQALNAEIATRMSKYEIYMANGRYDKYSERKRQRRLESAQPISR